MKVSIYGKADFFHLLIYSRHTYLQQVFEMYYNKNTGTTGLQTTDLYVSVENGLFFFLSPTSHGEGVGLSSLEEMVQWSRGRGVRLGVEGGGLQLQSLHTPGRHSGHLVALVTLLFG